MPATDIILAARDILADPTWRTALTFAGTAIGGAVYLYRGGQKAVPTVPSLPPQKTLTIDADIRSILADISAGVHVTVRRLDAMDEHLDGLSDGQKAISRSINWLSDTVNRIEDAERHRTSDRTPQHSRHRRDETPEQE